MRKEYDLQGGRPNPYTKRLGVSGRKKIVARFLESERLVKLDGEIAEAFPSNEAVNDALRLVLKLRDIAPRAAEEDDASAGARAPQAVTVPIGPSEWYRFLRSSEGGSGETSGRGREWGSEGARPRRLNG
jgi:hypothetical protein